MLSYSLARWRRLRQWRLSVEPLCRYCAGGHCDHRPLADHAPYCIRFATIVDHIIPHKQRKALFFDASNTQSMCKQCHDKIKQLEELAHGCDAKGYPVAPLRDK